MELLGIHNQLDEMLYDFGYLTDRYKEAHPANTGDVSHLLSHEQANVVLKTFSNTASDWFSIKQLQNLASIRNDGRTGYRAQGINKDEYYEAVKPARNRLILITRTGSDLPCIEHTIQRNQSGKLFTILETSDDASKIRLVYGNKQRGSIPSIETHIHIMGHALSLSEGMNSSAIVHSHPHYLVTLGRDKSIAGDFDRFNKELYSAIEGINRNCPDKVGVVAYHESGSEALTMATLPVLKKHKLALWMNHGAIARTENIRAGYTLIAYAENSARAALESIRHGAHGLPEQEITRFMNRGNNLSRRDYHPSPSVKTESHGKNGCIY